MLGAGMSMHELWLFSPEWIVLLGSCALLVLASFTGARSCIFPVSLLVLLVAGFCVLCIEPSSPVAANGHFIADLLSRITRAALCFFGALILLYTRYYRTSHPLRPEFFVLFLFAELGMMTMVSAGSLLTLYLGIELMSLSLYSLVAIEAATRGSSIEAAIKYFIMGALASSGILLYGISLIYGVSQAVRFSEITLFLESAENATPVLSLGVILSVVGILFKLGAVPFHWWIADLYQGAPTPVAMLVSSVSKIAAAVLAVRFFPQTLGHLANVWQPLLIVLAVLSLAFGSVVAIAQTNIKRMLAYSTIAHIGFLLLGIAANHPTGLSAAVLYALVYALMSIAAFSFLIVMSDREHSIEWLDELKGLAISHPGIALAMVAVMFSMAGIPPFLGFWPKWNVLVGLLSGSLSMPIKVILATLAVFFSVVSAFYYLRIVKLLYFDKPRAAGSAFSAMTPPVTARLLFGVHAASLLLLPLLIAPIMRWCARMVGS